MNKSLWLIALTLTITGFATGWAGSSLLRAHQAGKVEPTPAALAVLPASPSAAVPNRAAAASADASADSAGAEVAAASGTQGVVTVLSGAVQASVPDVSVAALPSATPSESATASVATAKSPGDKKHLRKRRKPWERRHLAGPTNLSERDQVASRVGVPADRAGETPALPGATIATADSGPTAASLPSSPAPEPAALAPAPETMVVVKRSEHRLYLYKEGELVRTFKVAVGKHRGSTPSGKFRIIGKAHNPAWNYKGKHVPGGSAANPLGKWWMALSVTHRSGTRFGIHGTNAPWSIGRSVSRGCIRMYNKDAASLFRQVNAGTPVVIY